MSKIATKTFMTVMVFLVMWQSGIIAISAIYTLRSDRMLESGRATPSDQVISLLDKAIALDSQNVSALVSRARLMTTSGSIEDMKDALVLYRHLLELQPVVAEHWAMLFFVKSHLDERDDERKHALSQIEQLGPYEPVASYLIVDAGTHDWLGLTPPMRDQVLNAASRLLLSASQYHKSRTLSLLQARGFLSVVCANTPEKQAIERYCGTAGS